MPDISEDQPGHSRDSKKRKSKIDIWAHPLLADLTPTEQIRALSDAFKYPSTAKEKLCNIPDCGVVLHRGRYCPEHQRERHATYERVAYARRGGKRKRANKDDVQQSLPLDESMIAADSDDTAQAS